ncbi:TPA: hypothetical protein ACF9CH_002836 [Staphylococcus aureus]|nr:hypothetical protein [Staphylococcus aureus]
MAEAIKLKRVKFTAYGSEFVLKLCKTCWGDEGISVYKDGYFMGLLDLLIADTYEEPLISIAKRIKKDDTLLDEVYA